MIVTGFSNEFTLKSYGTSADSFQFHEFSEAPSMASNKRALMAKAATSKASAWGTRATSKATAMAPTLSKVLWSVICG